MESIHSIPNLEPTKPSQANPPRAEQQEGKNIWSLLNLRAEVKFLMQQIKNNQAHEKETSEHLKKAETGKL